MSPSGGRREDSSLAVGGRAGGDPEWTMTDCSPRRELETPPRLTISLAETEVLKRLAGVGLPFAVPVPLCDVITVDGFTAVAVSPGPVGVPGEASRRIRGRWGACRQPVRRGR